MLTPSKVTAWLECPHYLTLTHRVQAGTFKATNGGVGEFARLLMDKGLEHERACLADYQRSGKTVHIVPDPTFRDDPAVRTFGTSATDIVSRILTTRTMRDTRRTRWNALR